MMMGMTMSQKILAAHAGLDEVKAGQLINAKLDMAFDRLIELCRGDVQYSFDRFDRSVLLVLIVLLQRFLIFLSSFHLVNLHVVISGSDSLPQ